MKLLFDENLSPELVANLTSDFPDSLHVREIGLERATAEDVWGYARGNGFAIVSKDSDFHQLSFLFGHPPKVIWIRRGNCSTAAVVLLRRNTPFHLSWVHSLGRRPLQSILQQGKVILNGQPNVLQIELVVIVDRAVTEPRDLFPWQEDTFLEFVRQSLRQLADHGKLHEDCALHDFAR